MWLTGAHSTRWRFPKLAKRGDQAISKLTARGALPWGRNLVEAMAWVAWTAPCTLTTTYRRRVEPQTVGPRRETAATFPPTLRLASAGDMAFLNRLRAQRVYFTDTSATLQGQLS